MNNSFLPPKAEQLQNYTKGQSFRHDLPKGRNWEEAMDALHFLCSHYAFYASIVTNTTKSFFGSQILNGKINLIRSRKVLPKDLKDILYIKFRTFDDLKIKIRNKSIWDENGARDVWHFTSRWKEFPKGSKVIELYQEKRVSWFSHLSGFRRAFIVLDARCSVAELNSVMFNVKKVFDSKQFTKNVLNQYTKKDKKQVTRTRNVETRLIFEKSDSIPAEKLKRTEAVRGRGPATLLMLLKDNFNFHVRSITLEEKAALYAYFENLKARGESMQEHEKMERKITAHFVSKNKKKGRI